MTEKEQNSVLRAVGVGTFVIDIPQRCIVVELDDIGSDEVPIREGERVPQLATRFKWIFFWFLVLRRMADGLFQ